MPERNDMQLSRNGRRIAIPLTVERSADIWRFRFDLAAAEQPTFYVTCATGP
jgi:hypothetical protein